jgi:hypothetical protein
MAELARALGTRRDALGKRIDGLAGGRRHLGELGAEPDLLDHALDVMLERGELGMTPDPPGRDELRALVESAW